MTLIFPDPLTVMSLPLIVISPFSFRMIDASPAVSEISSAALMMSFFPTVSSSFLPMLVDLASATCRVSFLPIEIDWSLLTSRASLFDTA